MKKKVVVIKSDYKSGGVWCDVNGSSMEIFTSVLALTENTIQMFKNETEDIDGKNALKTLLKDIITEFEKNGIMVSNEEEKKDAANDNN